jgi:hypothetical protein
MYWVGDTHCVRAVVVFHAASIVEPEERAPRRYARVCAREIVVHVLLCVLLCTCTSHCLTRIVRHSRSSAIERKAASLTTRDVVCARNVELFTALRAAQADASGACLRACVCDALHL